METSLSPGWGAAPEGSAMSFLLKCPGAGLLLDVGLRRELTRLASHARNINIESNEHRTNWKPDLQGEVNVHYKA